MQLSAKTGGKLATYNLELGDTLTELVARYGEENIYRCAIEKLKSIAQNAARHQLNIGFTPEQVRLKMENDFTPFKRMKKVGLDISQLTEEEINDAIRAIEAKQLEEKA
tara:strand:- start:87 stop:413 length:327 start_codon:yes stop_codon:yes gene_type:complete